MDHTNPYGGAANVLADIASIRAVYPSANIVLSETGYDSGTLRPDDDQRQMLRQVFNELSTLPYVIGLNYWTGYTYYNPTALYVVNSLTKPRPAAAVVNDFFRRGDCKNRLSVI